MTFRLVINGEMTRSSGADQWEGVSEERVETDRDNRSRLCSGVNTAKGVVPVAIWRVGDALSVYSLSKACSQGLRISEISF